MPKLIKDARQIGRMIATDAGNNCSSGRPERRSKGTRIIPPPAPNIPVTAPASSAANLRTDDFISVITSVAIVLANMQYLYGVLNEIKLHRDKQKGEN